jgi:ParB/RepB/Spo0J family partition protein
MSAPNKGLAARIAANRAVVDQEAPPAAAPPSTAPAASEPPRTAVGALILTQSMLANDRQEVVRLEGLVRELQERLTSGTSAQALDVSLIDDNPHQPRLIAEGIDELADNIAAVGQIQPISVRHGEAGRYILTAGQRRLAAIRKLGQATILANVDDGTGLVADDRALTAEAVGALRALAENLARVDLSDFEKYTAFQAVLDAGFVNQRQLAKLVGESDAAISRTMAFRRLPEPCLAILRTEPRLVGNNAAAALAEFCDSGHASLVCQGLEQLRERRIGTQEGVITWIRQQLAAPRANRAEVLQGPRGEPVFELRRTARQFTVSLPKGVPAKRLQQAVEATHALLAALAAQDE